MATVECFDAVVVGGGPAGATAAADLASGGAKVLLVERAFRIKPCGGAIPPRLIEAFDIPDEFVVGYGIDYAQQNRNLPYIGKVSLDG